MLTVNRLRVSYNDVEVVRGVDFSVPRASVTSIVGPNGSGKSTILKSLNRTIPALGSVEVAGKSAAAMSRREIAQTIGMLGQTREAPEDMTVEQLVALGRSPHRPWFRPLSPQDREIVEESIELAGLSDFRERRLTTMSGGEGQRAWIAMALAQRPQLLLLDEPTTFLDIAHQLEVFDLVRRINRDTKITVLMVVHDLNYAGFYSDQLIMLQAGEVVASGTPAQVLTADRLAAVYRLKVDIDYPKGDHWPRINTLPSGALL